jgi:hypothetical protein
MVMENSNLLYFYQAKKLTASFLIPERLRFKLFRKKRPHLNWDRYFLYLSQKYFHNDFVYTGIRVGVNRLYQPKGRNLIKLNCRIQEEVWAIFKARASFLGISACFLFVMLFLMDINEDDNDVGTPTIFQSTKIIFFSNKLIREYNFRFT